MRELAFQSPAGFRCPREYPVRDYTQLKHRKELSITSESEKASSRRLPDSSQAVPYTYADLIGQTCLLDRVTATVLFLGLSCASSTTEIFQNLS
jgi:hypothetical protein